MKRAVFLLLLAACPTRLNEAGARGAAHGAPGALVHGLWFKRAVDHLPNIDPEGAPDSDIDGKLIMSRLGCSIRHDATVEEMNTALRGEGASLAGSLRGMPLVSIRFPRAPSFAELDAKRARLEKTQACARVSLALLPELLLTR